MSCIACDEEVELCPNCDCCDECCVCHEMGDDDQIFGGGECLNTLN